MDVQLTKAVEVTPDGQAWARVKTCVRNLPGGFRVMLEQALAEEGAPRVKKHKRASSWDIDVSFRFEGHEILLNIVESFTGEIHRASYFAFSKSKNTGFIRDLLKEDVLNQF
jgi:hypothetical protein